ncbi:MAG TPA: CBS domain-containing protein [Actinocrinis sp.]|nr:CBS domain-containing protein [Actinocrinis sp.]
MANTDTTMTALYQLTARDLMGQTGPAVYEGATLRDVVDRFLTGPSRHLVVVDDDGRCLGILGPRHVAQAHSGDPRADADIPVKDLGYAAWISVRPTDDLRTCAQTLTEQHLDAIPVVDEANRAVGVVTAVDITRAVADAFVHRHPRWEE